MQHEFVHIQKLSVSLNSCVILNQIDLTMAHGDCVAIIGSNGSGKTTLLRSIAGLIRPTSGTIQVSGLSYSDQQQALKLKHLVGFAPDTPPLYQNDTVTTYLRFVSNIKCIAKNELNKRVNNYIDLLELNHVRNARIYTLSKGTQQRVNLAQALLNNPQILILDEPTNALDPKQSENLCKHLQELKRQKITLIIASHQYTEIVPLCNYMLKVNNGKLTKIMLPLSNQTIRETDDQIHNLA